MEKNAVHGNGPQPLWLNPWQYGTPDLISPLVIELIKQLKHSERTQSATLQRAAKTLLRAGNAMLFKALSVVVPAGSILEAAAEPIDSFIEDMFNNEEGRDTQDPDPIAAMAQRFRELVDEYLRFKNDPEGRLLICIDDLDRCLPHHQIAMLEAIHFLTGARASAFFLVALDPTLVQQAAVTYYRTAGFDSNQYLDKLFDLRVTLRALNRYDVERLINLELSRIVEPSGELLSNILERGLGIDATVVNEAFRETIYFPELTNPRLIYRVFQRLHLLARAGISSDLNLKGQVTVPDYLENRDRELACATVAWCAIAERWPSIRSVLQMMRRDSWGDYLKAFEGYYLSGDTEWGNLGGKNLISRLPPLDSNPDVGYFLCYACKHQTNTSMGTVFAQLDAALLTVGL